MEPSISLQSRATQGMDEAVQSAIDAAERGADPQWKDAAAGVLRSLALQRSEFSTDDIWFRLGEIGVSTPEPRAMGAIVRQAAREGLIEWTGMYRRSFRRACHRRPVAVWRSKVGPFSPKLTP